MQPKRLHRLSSPHRDCFGRGARNAGRFHQAVRVPDQGGIVSEGIKFGPFEFRFDERQCSVVSKRLRSTKNSRVPVFCHKKALQGIVFARSLS
jgi:hypothetical protein